jgi:hypothetical protein
MCPIPRTSWVTPKTLDNMLKSAGSAYPRRFTDCPDRREFSTLAFMYAAAVMMPYAPANVCRTRAILYDPLEISFAAPWCYLFSAALSIQINNLLISAGSSIDNKLCL